MRPNVNWIYENQHDKEITSTVSKFDISFFKFVGESEFHILFFVGHIGKLQQTFSEIFQHFSVTEPVAIFL